MTDTRVITSFSRALGKTLAQTFLKVRKRIGSARLLGIRTRVETLRRCHLARYSSVEWSQLTLSLILLIGTGLGCAGTGTAGFGKPTEAAAHKSQLPVQGRMPRLDASEWIGTTALTPEGLKGKVVLVDFWTYSCINCIRVTPYLNAWAAKYRDQGLVVLGVHTPEFGFEKRPENIREEMRRFNIQYPVAVDSEYRIWNAFHNQYWPAYYLVDGQGRVRYHQFGEGEYGKAEAAIQDLLAESRSTALQRTLVTAAASGVQAPPNTTGVFSPETYLGYRQASAFTSPERVQRDGVASYSAPTLQENTWALSGSWNISSDNAELVRAGGSIRYRFAARDLHLVMASSAEGKPVRFQVTLDGRPPGENHGVDTDSEGHGTVTGARLYQLIRQRSDIHECTFEIRFEDSGLKAFVFTFG